MSVLPFFEEYKAYYKAGHKGRICPFCKGYAEKDDFDEKFNCPACKKSWVEIFDLTGIEEI